MFSKVINQKNQSFLNFGNKLFLLGTFFLPTALPISALFFIPALLISFWQQKIIDMTDKWNYPIFISIGIILFSSINVSFINKPEILQNYNISYIWISLFNWLPIFIYFWGFQIYLKTYKQRINFSKFLIYGSLPVILSIFLQKFFNIYGPFKTFFGLIIWFQKPISSNSGAAGLFSNPNYTAMWLALVFPFTLFIIKFLKTSRLKQYITFTISSLTVYAMLLTYSRNALLSIVITFMLTTKINKFLLTLISSISIFAVTNIILIKINFFGIINSSFFPTRVFDRLLNFDFSSAQRPSIWYSTFLRIQERPLFGWGSSTFSFLYRENNQELKATGDYISAYHSHNFPMELAHNFGLPLAFLVVITIIFFLLRAKKFIYKKDLYSDENFLDKIWFTSIIVFFVTHLTDITFYDGKINILICLLFAGLKNIINKNEIKNDQIKPKDLILN